MTLAQMLDALPASSPTPEGSADPWYESTIWRTDDGWEVAVYERRWALVGPLGYEEGIVASGVADTLEDALQQVLDGLETQRREAP